MKPYTLDRDIDTIKTLYYEDKLSATAISKRYKVSHTAILDLLERHGFKRRHQSEIGHLYSLKDDFFDIIDTEAKAYWLGFLYADGYNDCGSKRKVVLKLQARDRDMVERFREAIGSSHPIKDILDGGRPQAFFRVCNKRLSMNLERLGAGQCKSLTLKFPTSEQVPSHLIHHFIRGYFDGDGCVTMSNNLPTHAQINICVSEAFGKGLHHLLMSELDIKGSVYRQSSNQIHHLAFGGRQQVVRFMEWMYKDANGLFMSRKYNRYIVLRDYVVKKRGPASNPTCLEPSS